MGIFKRLGDRGKKARPVDAGRYKGVEVMLDPSIFGANAKSQTMPVNFVFGSGGVGDYINWCASLQYVADRHKHVDARIFVSGLFLEVAQHIFGHMPRWKIIDRQYFRMHYEPGTMIAFPKPGQLINACGAHLLDLGFMYFCCMDEPHKDYNFIPSINYEGPWKWPELGPKSPYAIFTPGATSPVREMPVKAFNEIVQYTKSKNVIPVFLGKKVLSSQYIANFADYDFTQGVDLREKTTLLEATQLMRGAKFVIGIDNGLLHMAGTTETPIIFGHNIAALKHRVIRRRKGLTINLVVDEKDLACIGCQSKMRFLYHHTFKDCIFPRAPQRLACLEHLFKEDSKIWKWAIDEVLK